MKCWVRGTAIPGCAFFRPGGGPLNVPHCLHNAHTQVLSPGLRLNLNFPHASPKGTPKTLAQHEVLGTWHSHSWLCVFPPGWKPLECSPLPPQRTYAGTMSPGGTTQSEFSPRQSQRDAEDFSPGRSAGYVAQPFLAVRFSARVEAP